MLDIYFLVLVVRFDEELRNGSENIKWSKATTVIEDEYFELGPTANQT